MTWTSRFGCSTLRHLDSCRLPVTPQTNPEPSPESNNARIVCSRALRYTDCSALQAEPVSWEMDMSTDDTAPDSMAETDLGEVFISYSWDSEDHVRSVLQLSDRLRSEGVDCVLDQYEVSPPEGWPRWMDRKIRDAQFVLMVCTETYYKRVMGDEDAGKGLGVRWESGLIYQYIYNAAAMNRKFVPVLMRGEDQPFIPVPLQGASYYRVDTQQGYDDLYSRLVGKPQVERPKLGKIRSLPKKDIKTDISMYVSAPIDIELWNAAMWRATFFMVTPDLPPILGLGFLNEKPARHIFERWHQRYGKRDDFEELRVSIIEGAVEGEYPGYSVHIGADPDNTIKRYRAAGLTADHFLMIVTRINRMNPPAESKNLEMFKRAYRQSKTYFLVPGTCRPDGSQLKPILDLGIYKNAINFRKVEEIGPNDIDSVILGTGQVERPLTEFGERNKPKPAR